MSDGDTLFDSLSALIKSSGLYQGRWLCDESLVMILQSYYPKTKEVDGMRSKLAKRLNKAAGAFDDSNINKIYKAKFSAHCPFQPSIRRKINYY